MSTDYRSTVFLPNTDFPMKAKLPQREPEILARWKKLDMYRLLRQAARGRVPFILHDGPPYANGNIHTGTAMNKILKDVVAYIQAGGGIVYDSEPEAEYRETFQKAGALLNAINLAESQGM